MVVPNVLSLNVTWFSSIEDNSIKIYDYLVKVVDYVSNTLVQEYKKVKETSLVINKLMKNRTYFVAIQARNEVGYGKPSNVSATTLLAGTIKTVLRMSIDASLSNDGHLFWLHFLSYFQLSKILFIFQVSQPMSKSTIVQIAKICIHVQVYNFSSTALFPSSICFVLGPPDAPLVTNISVRGKQCSLQWREPYNGQSAILKYTVYVWGFVARLESYTKERLGLWNTTNLSYTLELDWDKMYWMAVSAWNKYGESFPLLRRKFRTEKNPKGKYSFYHTQVPRKMRLLHIQEKNRLYSSIPSLRSILNL